MKSEKKVPRIQQLRANAHALDDIGPCAWDDADSERKEANALAGQVPHFDVRAATKLAIGTGIVAGLIVYLVNGQDVLRAGIAAFIWLAIGWYSGKVIFPAMPKENNGASWQLSGSDL